MRPALGELVADGIDGAEVQEDGREEREGQGEGRRVRVPLAATTVARLDRTGKAVVAAIEDAGIVALSASETGTEDASPCNQTGLRMRDEVASERSRATTKDVASLSQFISLREVARISEIRAHRKEVKQKGKKTCSTL